MNWFPIEWETINFNLRIRFQYWRWSIYRIDQYHIDCFSLSFNLSSHSYILISKRINAWYFFCPRIIPDIYNRFIFHFFFFIIFYIVKIRNCIKCLHFSFCFSFFTFFSSKNSYWYYNTSYSVARCSHTLSQRERCFVIQTYPYMRFFLIAAVNIICWLIIFRIILRNLWSIYKLLVSIVLNIYIFSFSAFYIQVNYCRSNNWSNLSMLI